MLFPLHGTLIRVQNPSFVEDSGLTKIGEFTAKRTDGYPPHGYFFYNRTSRLTRTAEKNAAGDCAANEKGFISDYTDFTSMVSW